MKYNTHENSQGEKQVVSKEVSNVPLVSRDDQQGEAQKMILSSESGIKRTPKKAQKTKPQLIKCAECPKVYVRPGAYVTHVEKNHKKIEDKNELEKKSEEEDTALYRDMSVMLVAADQEDDKEAEIFSKAADKIEARIEEDRLGINEANTVTLDLEEIQKHALPAALEPVETNDEPCNNKDVFNLVNYANKELEKFLTTTKVSMTNEPLVELPTTVLPPPNSAASHYMNKSLSASQRLLFPEAHFLREMANKEDEKETEQEELVNTKDADEKQTETEEETSKESETAKSVVNDILSKMVFNMVENSNGDEQTFKEVDKIQKDIKMYKCRRCKFTTGAIKDLVNHTRKKHTCQYKCRVCKQMFIFKASLNQHTVKRHPEIMIVETPEKCNEECKMKDDVIKHKESVIDRKEKLIEKMTNEINKKHMQHEKLKEKHGNNLKSLNDKKKVVEENKRLREEANNAADLLKQIQERNLTLEEELKIKTQIIEADKTLRMEMEHHNQTEWLSDEVKQHNIPQYKCEKCEWKTHNKKYFTGHMTKHKAHEETPQLFKCSKCDFSISSNKELNEHMKVAHTEKEAEFKCNRCEKVFTAHNSLLQHAKSKHEDSSRLPVGHQSWTRHQERTKYQCTKCQKEFSMQADLNQHKKTLHEYLQCNQCEEVFENQNDLSHHNRTTHKNNQNSFTKVQRLCKYFQQGRCLKGLSCLFSHDFRRNVTPQQIQVNHPQACRRGPRCEFLVRGSCFYYHEGLRGQNQEFWGQEFRSQWQEPTHRQESRIRSQEQNKRPCHFQERCWNNSCSFEHLDFIKDTEFLENY